MNPLRYRGYYYDTDTQLYYLQSRYYDPNLGRFINADSYSSTGQGILGNNMYAYCLNNPVNSADPTGEIAITTLILIGSAIIGAACAGYTAYKEYQAGYNTVRIVGDSVCAGVAGFSIVYTGGMSLYQCYQNYCYLNAITPVTDVGVRTSSQVAYTNTSQGPSNPLEEITYTEKVQQQKQQSDFHGFPDIVDNYGGYGVQQTIIGGDGNPYVKLPIPGFYRGYVGAFVYIWDRAGVCNHRLFEVMAK